jgi:hypothetical protein
MNIVELDKEMARIKEVLTRISSRRKEICAEIEQHETLLSPVRRLPDELLSEIFIHCLPSLPTFPESSEALTYQTPLLLAQICSRWRAVALATPAIWSDIRAFRVDPWRTVRSKDIIALLKTFLRKSGRHPLSLALRDGCPNAQVDAALPFRDRWQYLELSLSSESIDALAPIRGALSSLRSLTVNNHSYDSINPATLDIFEIAPQLHVVKLVYKYPTHQWIKLPWAQLTEFSLERVDLNLDKCLDILTDCTSLISCHFHDLSQPTPSRAYELQTRPRPIHLRELSLTRLDLAAFLDCLTLPALYTMELHSYAFPKNLVDLLSRSSCILQKLTLSVSTTISMENLVRCLECTPELT